MWVVGVAGLTSGVLNCLTPASAYYNFWLFFIVRILIGFCAVSTLNFKIFFRTIKFSYKDKDLFSSRVLCCQAWCKFLGIGYHRLKDIILCGLIAVKIVIMKYFNALSFLFYEGISCNTQFLFLSGITTGTCSTFLICAAVQYYFRWFVGFYISGTLQIIWAGAWVFLVTDNPTKHSFISKEELSYLITAIGTVFNIKVFVLV